MAGEGMSQRVKSETYHGGGGSPGSGTPRHHWRSVSWTARSREREATEGSSNRPASMGNSQQSRSNSSEQEQDSSNDLSKQTSLLCPPLSSLSVSRGVPDGGLENNQRGPGEERKFEKFHRGRNGLDIKLDLGAVQEVSFQESDASEPTDSELAHKREKMALCEKQCSRIRSHLYFGSSIVAQDFETLRGNKITHILNCVGYVCSEYFPNNFQYKVLWLQDSPSEDLTSILYDCFDYIEEVKEQGGRVYVHCCQGVSRSAAIVIAYLMWREGRQFEDVLQDVYSLRGVTSPNLGFAFQLMQWQSRILGSPRSPSLRMFRMAPHSPYDPLHLVPKSVNSPSMIALDSRGAFVVQFTNRLFVWVGRMCGRCMAAAADKAAFQLIRYEHALGPIMKVRDGNEPSEFLDALNNSHYISDDGGSDVVRERLATVKENSLPCTCGGAWDPETTRGMLLNNSYDADYEAFDKARSGEVVSSLPDSTNMRGWDGRWNTPRHDFCCGVPFSRTKR